MTFLVSSNLFTRYPKMFGKGKVLNHCSNGIHLPLNKVLYATRWEKIQISSKLIHDNNPSNFKIYKIRFYL